MSNLKFSIVIPAYNRTIELQQCLNTIEDQTFPHTNFEVLVIDDGSSKAISDIIEQKKYSFLLKVIRIEHSGPSCAKNVGIKNAFSDYIVFFEDDVVIHKDYLSTAFSLISEKNYDVLEGRTLTLGSTKDVRIFDEENVYSFIPCNLIVRKNLLQDLNGYDQQFYDPQLGLYFREDADLGFRLLDKGVNIIRTDKLIVEHPEQFKTIGACLRHARRYFFEPLLYKKHPKRFRQLIERKRILGFQIYRPLHKLCIGMIMFLLITILGFVFGLFLIILIGILGVLSVILALQYKYEGGFSGKISAIIRLGAFFILPFFYWKAFLLGCIKFRSYGCIL